MKAKQIKNSILRVSKPFTKAIGKIHLPCTHKKINKTHCEDYLDFARPGQTLITRINGEATNLFIPGFFKHAAIYVGGGIVVEALGDGVVATKLEDFFMTKDYIICLSPVGITSLKLINVARWAENAVGMEYDWLMDQEDHSKFYCAEFPYAAYGDILKNDFSFHKRKIFGFETVTAQDYCNAKRKFPTVWESQKALREKKTRKKNRPLQRLTSR